MKREDLTKAQQASLEALKETWGKVEEPEPFPDGTGCVLVRVSGKNDPKYVMWIGIETDGYMHS